MVQESKTLAWDAILSGNKVFVITTRNFLPQLGGMQILMSDIAHHLIGYGPVKVFAEETKDSEEYDVKQKFDIERIKGFKLIRKFRKASQIENFFQRTNGIKMLISDHWKSIEKISVNVCNSVPTICLIHGKEINHPNKSPLNIRMLRSLSKAKYVIANSTYTKNLAIEKGIDKDKIKIINPGTTFSYNDKLEEDTALQIYGNSDPKIISVCRLEKRKGISQTLLALKNYESQYENFRYVIIGDGEEKKNLERQINELNLSKNIIFLTDISQKVKNSLINSADFFIMPSIQVGKSVEGFGISFLEAAKYGVPSIGGIVGGASDIIKHGETGYLCDGEKHDEIYEYLIKITKDKNYKELGSNAKKFAENFSWEKQIKKYIELL